MRTALLITMFAGGFCFAQAPTPAKVEGENELVQGTLEDGLTVYRGIPFSEDRTPIAVAFVARQDSVPAIAGIRPLAFLAGWRYSLISWGVAPFVFKR